MEEERPYKRGDLVVIKSKVIDTIENLVEGGENPRWGSEAWLEPMDLFIGKECLVFTYDPSDQTIYCKTNDGKPVETDTSDHYWFPIEALEAPEMSLLLQVEDYSQIIKVPTEIFDKIKSGSKITLK